MIVFIVQHLNPGIASFRYRGLWMAKAINLSESANSKTFITDKPEKIDVRAFSEFKLVVFVKTFNEASTTLAWQLHERRVPMAIDICDNILLSTYLGGATGFYKQTHFYALASLAGWIITPTRALSNLCQQHLKGICNSQYLVIPDGIEYESDLATLLKKPNKSLDLLIQGEMRLQVMRPGYKLFIQTFRLKLKNYIKIFFSDPTEFLKKAYLKITHSIRQAKLRPYARQQKNHRNWWLKPIKKQPFPTHSAQSKKTLATLIWFGNAGGVNGSYGIEALAKILPFLNMAARHLDFQLQVVSNDKNMYKQFIFKQAHFPCEYHEWHPLSIYQHIRAASACLIPNTQCEFSKTKSANRAVLALSMGTPVIAENFSDLAWLKEKGLLYVGDWADSLTSILTGKNTNPKGLSQTDLQACLKTHYGFHANSERWGALLTHVAETDVRNKKYVTIFLDLIQDLDVVRPIILKLIENTHYYLEVIITRWLAISSPRVTAYLETHHCNYQIIDRQQLMNKQLSEKLLYNTKTIIFPSETNLRPHQVAHYLANKANRMKIKTITLQHGLENVGLSYFDGDTVRFASNIILTWADTKDPKRSEETEKKIRPVGIFRESTRSVDRAGLIKYLGYNKIIGIFENLHWDRYHQDFRDFFVLSINQVANEFPNICFLVKPHHAGNWIKKNNIRFTQANIKVCELTDPFWEPWTGSDLVKACDLIVTTPSTISIDAALADKAVAVMAHQLTNLDIYQKLTRINTLDELRAFISTINHADLLESEKNKTRAFLQKQIKDINNFNELFTLI